jgi:hypothetical protein
MDTQPRAQSNAHATTRTKEDVRKLIQEKTCPVCGKKHFISHCPLLRDAGYTTTYNNPNSSPPLAETNAARAAALRVTQPMTAETTENQTTEGKSCVSFLSTTPEQQIVDHSPPTMACTHNLARLVTSTQNDSTSIAENDSPSNTLDQIYVSSHNQASVPVIVDRKSNTYNATKDEPPSPSPSRTTCMGWAETVQSPTGRVVRMVVDSGATTHMNPFHEAFISYKSLPPGHYMELANGRKVPVIGIGRTLQNISGKIISLMEVLHVPQLHSLLLSVRTFRRRQGCAFLADESICCLTFPTFLEINDDKDCVLPYETCLFT